VVVPVRQVAQTAQLLEAMALHQVLLEHLLLVAVVALEPFRLEGQCLAAMAVEVQVVIIVRALLAP
jgi:hypothetical protein